MDTSLLKPLTNFIEDIGFTAVSVRHMPGRSENIRDYVTVRFAYIGKTFDDNQEFHIGFMDNITEEKVEKSIADLKKKLRMGLKSLVRTEQTTIQELS